MPITELSRLSDDATVWIFGITPAIADPEPMLRRVDEFLDSWAAHGAPIRAGRELRENRFLIVAAENYETSGCSIDRLFGLVRDFEQRFGVSMLDPGRIYFRNAAGEIADVARADFGGVANADSMVFDPSISLLGDLRGGKWEKPTRDSWHASLLRRSA